MPRNVACTDNLSKQKIKPVLYLFLKELTLALRNECGNEAAGTANFLEFF